MGSPAIPVLDSLSAVNAAMYKLLLATLRNEKAVATRDREIAAVQKLHSPAIDKSVTEIATLESQIGVYCVTHPECLDGKKSIQLQNGLMGMRAPSSPALVPFDESWTWERIGRQLKLLWKSKFFHAPKPPGPDKVKIKKLLDAAELKTCGMRLDETETFFLELNRLSAGEVEVQAA